MSIESYGHEQNTHHRRGSQTGILSYKSCSHGRIFTEYEERGKTVDARGWRRVQERTSDSEASASSVKSLSRSRHFCSSAMAASASWSNSRGTRGASTTDKPIIVILTGLEYSCRHGISIRSLLILPTASWKTTYEKQQAIAR